MGDDRLGGRSGRDQHEIRGVARAYAGGREAEQLPAAPGAASRTSST
ncbi:MAG: hypothetical protein M3O70_25010 [Actinomycetota bacterium]|nr:hypothetical protein [Actinomycetota bacterium]